MPRTAPASDVGTATAPPPAVSTGQPLLAAEEVDFSYGHHQVLFGISLEVNQGGTLALLGTNGAGKSTFLRCVAGLQKPSAGRICFDGQEIGGLPAEEVVRMGIVLVSGGRAVFGDMSVEENLQMQSLLVRHKRQELRQRMDKVFATFPALVQRRSNLAASLSGGEQQQLALAKAFFLEPRLLCVDELSLGLAPVVVQALLEVVRDIIASGVTVLLVEQSLNIAASLCGRAVFLEKGQVRFEGPTSQLLDNDEVARAVFLGEAD